MDKRFETVPRASSECRVVVRVLGRFPEELRCSRANISIRRSLDFEFEYDDRCLLRCLRLIELPPFHAHQVTEECPKRDLHNIWAEPASNQS